MKGACVGIAINNIVRSPILQTADGRPPLGQVEDLVAILQLVGRHIERVVPQVHQRLPGGIESHRARQGFGGCERLRLRSHRGPRPQGNDLAVRGIRRTGRQVELIIVVVDDIISCIVLQPPDRRTAVGMIDHRFAVAEPMSRQGNQVVGGIHITQVNRPGNLVVEIVFQHMVSVTDGRAGLEINRFRMVGIAGRLQAHGIRVHHIHTINRSIHQAANRIAATGTIGHPVTGVEAVVGQFDGICNGIHHWRGTAGIEIDHHIIRCQAMIGAAAERIQIHGFAGGGVSHRGCQLEQVVAQLDDVVGCPRRQAAHILIPRLIPADINHFLAGLQAVAGSNDGIVDQVHIAGGEGVVGPAAHAAQIQRTSGQGVGLGGGQLEGVVALADDIVSLPINQPTDGHAAAGGVGHRLAGHIQVNRIKSNGVAIDIHDGIAVGGLRRGVEGLRPGFGVKFHHERHLLAADDPRIHVIDHRVTIGKTVCGQSDHITGRIDILERDKRSGRFGIGQYMLRARAGILQIYSVVIFGCVGRGRQFELIVIHLDDIITDIEAQAVNWLLSGAVGILRAGGVIHLLAGGEAVSVDGKSVRCRVHHGLGVKDE